MSLFTVLNRASPNDFSKLPQGALSNTAWTMTPICDVISDATEALNVAVSDKEIMTATKSYFSVVADRKIWLGVLPGRPTSSVKVVCQIGTTSVEAFLLEIIQPPNFNGDTFRCAEGSRM